ncbi:MAG: M24 family metallopeptidase, partial [Lachnospiraceae bacterium]
DIPGNPVVLSYLMLTEEKLYLFIHKETLNEETKAYLADLGVSVKPYDAVYEYVKSIRDETVLLESSRTNYAIFHLLDSSNRIVDAMNPTALAKAVKNPVEIENMKRAHIKDGVAVTKFIYWLKSNIGQIPMDEMSVAEHLEGLRKQQKGYIEPSFSTISAYGSNAAMCHYRATEETNRKLEPRGLYLVDSGGQYFEGTTDITRTIALGELTKDEREHFTLTVMAMLRLGSVKFLYGCRGMNLDYAAREVLFQRVELDWNRSWWLPVNVCASRDPLEVVPERQDSGVLEAGMVTSDEPGVYIEGSHGIRTENLLLCKEAEKNLYGQFMEFEYLTFAPIDLDAIDVSIMEDKDVERLNQYHQAVYEKLAPYLEEKEHGQA